VEVEVDNDCLKSNVELLDEDVVASPGPSKGEVLVDVTELAVLAVVLLKVVLDVTVSVVAAVVPCVWGEVLLLEVVSVLLEVSDDCDEDEGVTLLEDVE